MAASHPDYASFAANLSSSHLANFTLPPELAHETLAVLSEDPEQAAAIAAMRDNPDASQKFMSGGATLTLISVAFLLRTHIRFKRNQSGQWEFLIEHKAADSKLVSTLLAKLEDWLGASAKP
ncbi:MAG: hypothetical protein ACRERV_00995 [Methylococcales bacterium]